MDDKKLVLLSGTYTNKGGLAIVYGTLKVLNELGIKTKYIVDPEPSFPDSFYKKFNLTPVYRWSHRFGTGETKSLTLLSSVIPFVNLIRNFSSSQVKQLHGYPIWYIGDSSLNDYGSVLALLGQIINLLSLKLFTGGKLLVNASMGYMRTEIGEFLLKFFLRYVNVFLVRGTASYKNITQRGVPISKVSIVSDMAFFLDKNQTSNTKEMSDLISKSEKPPIALIFKNYSKTEKKSDYIYSIKKLANSLKKKHSVFFIPTSYVPYKNENDLEFLNEIGVENILNINHLDPTEIIEVFTNFEAVVTLRLHGAVYSALAGVPTYHIYEADNSLDVIKDTFGELIPLLHVSDFINGDIEKIHQDVERLIHKRDKISFSMRQCIEENKEKTIETIKNSIKTYL